MPIHTLKHLRLPALTTYQTASRIQEHIVNHHLAYKRLTSNAQTQPPPPVLITSQFHPIYTLGRRQRLEYDATKSLNLDTLPAPVVTTSRGGQITFHGPGQITAYLIADIKALSLTPRCYIRFLEDTVIETIGAFGIKGHTEEEAGIWVEEGDKKICAVGVRMQRYIASHGIGLNVQTDLGRYFRGKIVACGLEGRDVTSMSEVLGRDVEVEEVEQKLVDTFAKRMGVDNVDQVSDTEVFNWKIDG